MLLVTRPPAVASGTGIAYCLREIARRPGRFPAHELSAVVGQHVGLRDWSDLPRICADANIAEVVIAYPAEPYVLRQLATCASAARFGLAFAPALAGSVDYIPVAR